jgi:hypothetical protein
MERRRDQKERRTKETGTNYERSKTISKTIT